MQNDESKAEKKMLHPVQGEDDRVIHPSIMDKSYISMLTYLHFLGVPSDKLKGVVVLDIPMRMLTTPFPPSSYFRNSLIQRHKE